MNQNTLLTIGKFSELTNVPVTTLIYYDNKGIFNPVHRGDNNYRYYSYFQTVTIKLLNVLKDLDVPLNTIKTLTKDRTPEVLLELLLQKEQEIPDKLTHLCEVQKIIRVFSEHIRKGINAENNHVSVKYLPQEHFSLDVPNDFSREDSFYEAFLRYCRDAYKKGKNLSYPVGGWWSSMNKFLENPIRPEYFFSVDPDGDRDKSVGQYLVGYTQCFYGEINDLPQRMVAYANKHRLNFNGPMFNIFLFDEVSTIAPDRYLLQASIAVFEK